MHNRDYSTKQGYHSDSMENQKFYRQEKAKRIQHNQTSLTTNAKGNTLGGKHKRRKRHTKANQKQL